MKIKAQQRKKIHIYIYISDGTKQHVPEHLKVEKLLQTATYMENKYR